MPPEAYTAAAEAIKNVNSHLQLAVAVFICISFLIGAWLTKVDRDSKKLVAANRELEKSETEKRKIERDKREDEMENRLVKADTAIMENLRTVNEKLENHINSDRANEDKMQLRIDKMDDKLRNIESSMVMRQEFSIFAQKMSADFSGLNSRIGDMREAMIKLTATFEERERAKHEPKQ